jgi:hypothetical protein
MLKSGSALVSEADASKCFPVETISFPDVLKTYPVRLGREVRPKWLIVMVNLATKITAYAQYPELPCSFPC